MLLKNSESSWSKVSLNVLIVIKQVIWRRIVHCSKIKKNSREKSSKRRKIIKHHGKNSDSSSSDEEKATEHANIYFMAQEEDKV